MRKDPASRTIRSLQDLEGNVARMKQHSGIQAANACTDNSNDVFRLSGGSGPKCERDLGGRTSSWQSAAELFVARLENYIAGVVSEDVELAGSSVRFPRLGEFRRLEGHGVSERSRGQL